MAKSKETRTMKTFEMYPILTEDEELWERVTTERLIEIVQNADDQRCEVSSNSYGEFLFVDVLYGSDAYTFYGAGYHEYRGRYYVNEWRVYTSSISEGFTMSKEEVINEILRKEDEIRNMPTQRRTENQALFDVLADVADDDFVIELMQDFGY